MTEWHESEGDEWKGEQPYYYAWSDVAFDRDGPRRLGMYILDENDSPVLAESTIEWARWLEANDARRQVGFDRVDRYQVSTIFVGLDQSLFTRAGRRPVLFETMVFADDRRDPLNLERWRYSTWAEAVTGHAQALGEVRHHVEHHQ